MKLSTSTPARLLALGAGHAAAQAAVRIYGGSTRKVVLAASTTFPSARPTT